MRLCYLLAVLATALFVGACGRPAPTPTAVSISPGPTPDIEATVEAEVQARLRTGLALTPTPVPLAPASREAIVAFVTFHREIIRDWDAFHISFDTWRSGLAACAPSSVEVTLRGFAAAMGDVAKRAGELPRSASERALADKIIAAAEGEANAFRILMDGWQADDPTPFENVVTERSTAQTLVREVQDALADLTGRATRSSRVRLDSYASAVARVGSQWDDFRQSYDVFRAQEADQTSSETVVRLSQLVAEFRSIVLAVRDLPVFDVTEEVSMMLAEAAEAEDLALRRLRGTFQKSPAVSGEAPVGPPDSVEGETDLTIGPSESEAAAPESAGGARVAGVEVIFTPRDPALFDAFNTQLAESNALRRQAVQEIARLFEVTSEDAQIAVEQFTEQFVLVLDEWDLFHKQYDGWRRSEGGCDRSMAAETLGLFTSDLAALTHRTRGLPGGALLGPLRELLVEAAELEEEGSRVLRNTWRPFDVEMYKAFDSQRTSAAKLLRQIAVRLDALLVQYGIPPPAV